LPNSALQSDRLQRRLSFALGPEGGCVDRMDEEVKMSDLAEVLGHALSLDVHDRAALAERLLASLEELSEEKAERLVR